MSRWNSTLRAALPDGRPGSIPASGVSGWHDVEMELDIPCHAALWKAGFHPGQRRLRLGRCRDGTRHSGLRCPMEGRVPSRPAVSPVGMMSRWNSTFRVTLPYGRPGSIPASGVSGWHDVEMELDIPGYAAPWKAGFHPGQRYLRLAQDVEMELDTPGYAALWKAGFHPGRRLLRLARCRDGTRHSGLRCPVEGRVPSRPAASPVGMMSRWNSTFHAALPYGRPGSIPASGISGWHDVEMELDTPGCAALWKAGFHPGQRRLRLARCRDGTRHSGLRCPMEGRVPSRPAESPVGMMSRWNSTLRVTLPDGRPGSIPASGVSGWHDVEMELDGVAIDIPCHAALGGFPPIL